MATHRLALPPSALTGTSPGAFALWSRFPIHIKPPAFHLFFFFLFFPLSPESMVAIFCPWVNGENGEDFGTGWSNRRGITGITLHSLNTNSPKSYYCNIRHSWSINHWSLWVFFFFNQYFFIGQLHSGCNKEVHHNCYVPHDTRVHFKCSESCWYWKGTVVPQQARRWYIWRLGPAAYEAARTSQTAPQGTTLESTSDCSYWPLLCLRRQEIISLLYFYAVAFRLTTSGWGTGWLNTDQDKSQFPRFL